MKFILGFMLATALGLIVVGGQVALKGERQKDGYLETLGLSVTIPSIILIVLISYLILNFPQ